MWFKYAWYGTVDPDSVLRKEVCITPRSGTFQKQSIFGKSAGARTTTYHIREELPDIKPQNEHPRVQHYGDDGFYRISHRRELPPIKPDIMTRIPGACVHGEAPTL